MKTLKQQCIDDYVQVVGERRIPLLMWFGITLVVLAVAMQAYGYRLSDDPAYRIYTDATVSPVGNGAFKIVYSSTIYGEESKQAAIMRVYLMADGERIVASVPEVLQRMGPRVPYKKGEVK